MATNKNFKIKKGIDIGVLDGTMPITTVSTTLCTNLNADMVDGFSASISTTPNTIPVRDSSGNIPGNILGNAATVTSGVYTTGSYADPAWITSLDFSKLTNVPNNLVVVFQFVDATTGNKIFQLPDPTTSSLAYNVKKIDATGFSVTITTAGTGATIDGATSMTLNNKNDSRMFKSYGNVWYLI